MIEDPAKEAFIKYIATKKRPEEVITFIRDLTQIDSSLSSLPSLALKGMLQRSVKTLAEQLNASDGHFILELIQNFEDNEYGPARPMMLFHLSNDLLFVACNEVGMKPTDVYSLCNVADSTKKDNKGDAHGYIGEKGIGFKSVFKIAHTVDIFSCFDFNDEDNVWKFNLTEKERKGIGYIVPEFITTIPSNVKDVFTKISQGSNRPSIGGTCLVLHLKAGKVDPVIQQIKKIKPQTIMFLRRICEVKLNVGGQTETIKAVKEAIPFPSELCPTNSMFHCTISHTTPLSCTSEAFVVFQGSYNMKAVKCKEREGVFVRSLSLAIPHNGIGSQSKGLLFSYLPTEQNTYLPFHVNGDFILTASRDSVLFENDWNVLLFNHLVTHIAMAAYCFSKMQLPVDALQLVPTAHPPSRFFINLLGTIIAKLKQLEIVPVIQNKPRVKGSDCMIVPHQLIGLITRPVTAKLSIIDPEKQANFALECSLLGVKDGDKNALEDVIQSQIPTHNPDPLWFSGLYTFMASHSFWNQKSIEATTKLCIILLADLRLTTFGTTVYLPYFESGLDPLRKWLSGVPTVASAAIPTETRANSLVLKWFKANKICFISAKAATNYILDHITDPSLSVPDLLELTHVSLKAGIQFNCGTIPFVSKDQKVIRPPFKSPIIQNNNKHLAMYADADRRHFHLMAPEYDNFPTELQGFFTILAVPPLPNIFSWMQADIPSTKQVTDLLSILALSKDITPGIQGYLNSREWLPTTMGQMNPSAAYLPTPELLEMFDQGVPFVIEAIYNNEKHRTVMEKHTRVIRHATVKTVSEQLEYLKSNNTNNLSTILPLVKFLLDKGANPQIPYCEHGKEWQWKSVADCLWELNPIPEIPTSRVNLASSIIDLKSLKENLERNGLHSGYTFQECISAWQSFVSSASVNVASVEAVLILVYTTFAKDLAKRAQHLPVWCGNTHKFQPRNMVVHSNDESLAKCFAVDQLKLLWVPPKSGVAANNELSNLLGVPTLSSVMINRVQWSPGPTSQVGSTPLFSRVVRRTLCCWHYSNCKKEWNNGTPKHIVQLLQIPLTESPVFKLEVVKCARINKEIIESSSRKPSKAYIDMASSPPTLRRSALPGNEVMMFREFAAKLTKLVKVDGPQRENLKLVLEDAIRSQKDYPIEYRLGLEEKYPVMPQICKTETSTAYLPQVSKQEKAAFDAEKHAAALSSSLFTQDDSKFKHTLNSVASGDLSLDQMISKLQDLISQTQNYKVQEEARQLEAKGQLFCNQFERTEPRKALKSSASYIVKEVEISALKEPEPRTLAEDDGFWSKSYPHVSVAPAESVKFTSQKTSLDFGTPAESPWRDVLNKRASPSPIQSATWDRAESAQNASTWSRPETTQNISSWGRPGTKANSRDQSPRLVPVESDSEDELKVPSGNFLLKLDISQVLPTQFKRGKRKGQRQRAPNPFPSYQEIDPHVALANPAQRDGNLPGMLRIVAERPNQAALREAALKRYEKCVVTGTPHPALLEAAHIKPKSDGGSNVDNDENILLLRLDIHRMFDMEPPLVYFIKSERSGFVRVHFTNGAENVPSYQLMEGTEIALHPLSIYLLGQHRLPPC